MFRMILTKDAGGSANAICKNGAIYFGVLDYKHFDGFVAQKWRDHKIDAEIIRTSDDIENQLTCFITVKEAEKYKLKYLFRKRLLDFTNIEESANENLQVVTI